LRDPVAIVSLWHATLGNALAAWAEYAMAVTGTRVLALGGGCCANRVLLRGMTEALQGSGCTLLTARALPTGDDAISYGQAWAAIESLADGAH
jgi:hydrogenase maturation protein HypF